MFPQNFLSKLKTLLWFGGWFFGLSLWLWYLIRWLYGDQLLLIRLAAYFVPCFFVGAIVGLIIAGIYRHKWLMILFAGPTLGIASNFAPLFWPGQSLSAQSSIKVMSHNLFGENKNVTAIAQTIGAEQPDILLLQELNPEIVQPLIEQLKIYWTKDKLFFDIVHEPEHEHLFSQAVISRYPVIPLEVDFDKGRAQKVLIQAPSGPITLWNVHPLPPKLDWMPHYQQVSNLIAEIAQTETPLIVGGDFNLTDQSTLYHAINQHLQNAHWEAGWGLGASFPSAHANGYPFVLVPLYRIDHIFYSHHFYAYHAYTVSGTTGSDHLPIVAELGIK